MAFPKSSRSVVLRPNSLRSAPTLASFSCPLTSWQPEQPYLVISLLPASAAAANSGLFSSAKKDCFGGGSPFLRVSRYAVMSAASWSVSRRLGIRVCAHIKVGFFNQAKSQRWLALWPMFERFGAKSRAFEPLRVRGASHSPGSVGVPRVLPAAICSAVQSLSEGVKVWQPRQPTFCTRALPRAASPETGTAVRLDGSEFFHR